MNTSILKHPVVQAGLVLALLSVIWAALGSPVELVTRIAIYTLYGAGVNLLVAYTGLVPFGASVFFGTASYFAAFFIEKAVGNEILALIASMLFAGVLALVIGLIILRRKGLYFSLLTLAFSQIAWEIAFRWTDVTGGENGMQGVPRPMFTNPWAFHIFAITCVLLAMQFLWRLGHAPFGRVLQAVRDNDQRAQSLGYDIFAIRLKGFILMAMVVGLSGALLTLLLQGVYADNLGWQHAGDSLLMTVVGGIHHFLGPLWGAITFIVMEDRLSAITEDWWLIFAPVLIAFALFSPEGIQGLVQRLRRRAFWSLTRQTIPARPAVIKPYEPSGAQMDPGKPILYTQNLSKQFGSLVTAKEINLEVRPFVLHSVLGPNGAGKTTMFNMLTGVLPPTSGKIFFDGKDITNFSVHARARLGISRSFQILSVFPNLTVFENVRVAVQGQKIGTGGLFADAHGLEAINDRTWSILDAVGLADKAAEACTNLPHGAKRLLEIAVTLSIDSKLLLLDEPLAGLAEADRVVVAALIKKLSEKHAVLLIEHDIDRVLAISDRISVLHQGRIVADGKPMEVANDPEVIAAYLGAADDGSRVAPSVAERTAHHTSKVLLKADNIFAGYGGSTVLNGVSLTVHEGEAVALLGRNGVGKTTLLRALTGSIPLTSGSVTFGGHDTASLRPFEINRLGLSLVPEGRRLFPNLTVTENLQLALRPGGISIEEVFELFPRLRTRQKAKAENLSGGERQMVAIARSLVVPSKLILLDEPFEGLAPAVVSEVMEALLKRRGKVAMVIVEHHAEKVLPIADRATVLNNGKVAFEGDAVTLENDHALQARLLGIVHTEDAH